MQWGPPEKQTNVLRTCHASVVSSVLSFVFVWTRRVEAPSPEWGPGAHKRKSIRRTFSEEQLAELDPEKSSTAATVM